MDPNLFHIDYERSFEVLATIVFLSMIIERALSLLFESRPFIQRTENKHGIKELISLVVSCFVCVYWQFDALTILIVSSDRMTVPGMLITGGLVAGGSKGSIALFQGWLGFMSTAAREQKEVKKKALEVKLKSIA
jgi:hypothetical protein